MSLNHNLSVPQGFRSAQNTSMNSTPRELHYRTSIWVFITEKLRRMNMLNDISGNRGFIFLVLLLLLLLPPPPPPPNKNQTNPNNTLRIPRIPFPPSPPPLPSPFLSLIAQVQTPSSTCIVHTPCARAVLLRHHSFRTLLPRPPRPRLDFDHSERADLFINAMLSDTNQLVSSAQTLQRSSPNW